MLFSKIVQPNIFRKKKFRAVILAELFLLLFCVINLFGKHAEYSFGPENAYTNISLSRGTYQIRLQYSCDQDFVNSCVVTDETRTSKELQCNGGVLYAGLPETDFEMWLYQGTDHLCVTPQYGGVGSLQINGLCIQQTNALQRMELFWVIVGILLINGLICLFTYDRENGLGKAERVRILLLGLMLIGSIMPFTLDMMLNSGDGGFHLQRIEGIKEALLTGQFPIRISPQWVQGHGYAAPIFYGETLLLPAGLLRLIGFSVVDAYRIYMSMVAAATVLISYISFAKAFANRNAGLLCSFLYSFSVYRIYTLFCRGAFGEALAIMLLPILFYGFYRVFTSEVTAPDYKQSWIPLTIGFTLLIQTHLLSCEMVGVFTILLCLILWKKTFRLPTFWVLAKTVIYSSLLSLWYLVPFLDYLTDGNYVINHVSGRRIQERGVYVAHLLWTWVSAGENTFYSETGMYSSHATAIGPALLLVLGLFLYYFFRGKMRKAPGIIMASFSLIAMGMSLSSFPWDRIQDMSSITATLVSSLQFPFRLLTIPTLLLTGLAGYMYLYFEETYPGDAGYKQKYVLLLSVLMLIGNVYLMDGLVQSSSFVRIYNNEGMGMGYVSGAEYMPYGSPDTSQYVYHAPIVSDGVSCGSYTKKGLNSKAYLENIGDTSTVAVFDSLYYPGYKATSLMDGTELAVEPNDIFEVSVTLPAHFAGEVQLRYVSPWYWRLAEVLSGVVFCILFAAFLCARKKTKYLLKEEEALHEGVENQVEKEDFAGAEMLVGIEESSLFDEDLLRKAIKYVSSLFGNKKNAMMGTFVVALLVSLPLLSYEKYGLSMCAIALLCNLMTAGIAYISIYCISGMREVAFCGSALWLTCPYRLTDLYHQRLTRESIIWCFLPIVVWGIFELFRKKRKLRGCGLLVCFAAVVCVMNYHYDGSLGGTFRENGMYLYQYFITFPGEGTSLTFHQNGLQNAQGLGMGLPLLVLLIVYAYRYYCGSVKKEHVLTRFLWVGGLWCMLLSLQAFPWNLLQGKSLMVDRMLALLVSPAKFGIGAITAFIGLGYIALEELFTIATSEEVLCDR